MLQELMGRYLEAIDLNMREMVNAAPVETPGYGMMLRYPFGWVDEQGNPYNKSTGKRIRPILLLLCTEAAGGDWQTALPAASAVEILHNFSLIHDDIQDNSPVRHNRPTLWKVWGVANGINAGDALFTLSFVALSKLTERGVSAEIALQCLRVFSNMALELTRGQHLDMRFEHQGTVTAEEYISMISGKTSALLSACAEMGALIGCGDSKIAAKYADFGLNLGISFQIRDDILGIWGDAEVTGKSAATDILSRKKSLPVIYGLERSNALADLYNRETFGEADVQPAVELLNSVGAREYAHQQETKFYQRAIESLNDAQPQGTAAQALNALIDLLFQRTS